MEKDAHFMNVEGFIVPDLKIVHKYPDLYKKFVVDEGAIKFVLKGIFHSNLGANVMAPGLVNEHSSMEEA